MSSWKEFFKEQMTDPEIKDAYEKLPPVGFIAQIIKARKKLNLTQEDVARKTGFKQPAIARIERSSVSPSARNLVKIAEALGMEWKLTRKKCSAPN
jgi:predicted transcriptional regulator